MLHYVTVIPIQTTSRLHHMFRRIMNKDFFFVLKCGVNVKLRNFGWCDLLSVLLKVDMKLIFSKYILLVLLWRIYPCMFFLDCNFQSECHNSTFCPLSNHFVCLNSTSFLIDCKLAFRSASIQSTTDGLESLPCFFFFLSNQFYSDVHGNT